MSNGENFRQASDRQVDAALDNKILTLVGRISGPVLLACGGPALVWVITSINSLQREIYTLQKDIAIVSDRAAQSGPLYRPNDALRDQAVVDQRMNGIVERINRMEKAFDELMYTCRDIERLKRLERSVPPT